MRLQGIARLQLSADNYAACQTFYSQLVEVLGGKVVAETPTLTYWMIGSVALVLSRSTAKRRNVRKRDEHLGLSHVCYRVRSRQDVERLQEFAGEVGAKVIHPAGPWPWSHFSVVLEDPDGNRLEFAHIPRKGHLDETATIPTPTTASRHGR